MIPDCFQRSVSSTADKRIRTVLVRVFPGIEFLHRHVGRIETCSCRTVTIPIDERSAVGAVPGTVVDFGKGLLVRILDPLEQSLPVAEILLPIDGIDNVGGVAVKPQYLLSIIGDSAQVRSVISDHRIIRHSVCKGRLGCFGARYCRHKCQGGKK